MLRVEQQLSFGVVVAAQVMSVVCASDDNG